MQLISQKRPTHTDWAVVRHHSPYAFIASSLRSVCSLAVATVTVGSSPQGIAYDYGKGEIFVANSGGDTVSMISDTANVLQANITVGNNPSGVAYDSAKGEIFVANYGSNTTQ